MYTHENIYVEKKTFRELKKNARVSNITCTAFAIKTPYKDL